MMVRVPLLEHLTHVDLEGGDIVGQNFDPLLGLGVEAACWQGLDLEELLALQAKSFAAGGENAQSRHPSE